MQVTRLLRAASDKVRPPYRGVSTGFSIEDFRAATQQPVYDPWERRETWRREGRFTRWNRFNQALPGLGVATVAFATYCGIEYLFFNDDHHGHGEGHGDGTHGQNKEAGH